MHGTKDFLTCSSCSLYVHDQTYLNKTVVNLCEEIFLPINILG